MLAADVRRLIPTGVVVAVWCTCLPRSWGSGSHLRQSRSRRSGRRPALPSRHCSCGARSLWPAVWSAAFLANLGYGRSVVGRGWHREWQYRRGARRDVGPSARFRFLILVLLRVSDVVAFVGRRRRDEHCHQRHCRRDDIVRRRGLSPGFVSLNLWFDWWLGYLLAVLVVAPALLTTARARTAGRAGCGRNMSVVIGVNSVDRGCLWPHVHSPPAPARVRHLLFRDRRCRPGSPTHSTALVGLAASAVIDLEHGSGRRPSSPASRCIRYSFCCRCTWVSWPARVSCWQPRLRSDGTSERRRAAAYAVGEVLGNAPDLSQA